MADWHGYINAHSIAVNLISKDIRLGILDRADGLKIIERLEGYKPNTLKALLEEMDIEKEEFIELTKRHAKVEHAES